MKIGIVSSEFHPMNAAAAARAESWASLFVELGHEVTVFTSREAGPSLNLVRSWFRVPDNRASLAKRFIQELCLGLDLACRLIFRGRDTQLNLITSPPFFMATCCAFACRLARIPYVFDVRDRYPNVLFELGVLDSKGWPGQVLRGLERMIYGSSSLVSTVTRGLLFDLREMGYGGIPCLSRNGYSEQVFAESLSTKEKFSQFTVVYHGRLGRFYDRNALREVMVILERLEPGIRFLIIGESGDFRREVSAETVEFMDEMPLDELAPVLSQCHLGICLLKQTGAMRKALPAKFFDFIGAGLPVIASPGGEMVEAIEKEGLGIGLQKNDPSLIAEIILDFYRERDRLEKLRTNVLLSRPQFGRRAQAEVLLETMKREVAD